MNLRSLAAGVLTVALIGLGTVQAHGENFIKPGDSRTINLQVENETPSTATALGTRLVATFEEVSPAGLAAFLSIDEAGSILGPLTVEVGADNAQTFKAKVHLADGAPDGSFKVRLHPTVENADLFISPDPDTLDSVVRFQIVTTPPKLTLKNEDVESMHHGVSPSS